MVKRTVDIAGAMAGLAVLTPLLVAVVTAILIDSGLPVFFVQERAGYLGRPFKIIKFRTMVHDADALSCGRIIGEVSQLITKSGRFLRRWSLDELPELVNVLKGDMSLVGPRPTLLNQVAHYDAFQQRRLDARPGLTGWAQVNGRNSLDWAHRIRLDVWYVEHWSLWLDLWILVRTAAVVTRHVDVYADTSPQGLLADDSGTPSAPHSQT
jgi:lipopolysaccharide/colanic/teichoic acid biosynthesis glycosyltransferase